MNVSTREGREECHRRREAFFACHDRGQSDCAAERALFEGACPASWVRHFEASRRYEREKAARIAQIMEQDKSSRTK